jgi:hypothetical protein
VKKNVLVFVENSVKAKNNENKSLFQAILGPWLDGGLLGHKVVWKVLF